MILTENLKHIIESRSLLTFNNKKKLLKILKEHKKSIILEDEGFNEQNIIAKKFNTNADFDSYVAQHRGLKILPKEQQAVINYRNAKPSEFTKFYIKYESTDDFSNNSTIVVKKLKEGNQYCWTAFSKSQASSATNITPSEIQEADDQPQPQQAEPFKDDTEPNNNGMPTKKPDDTQPEQPATPVDNKTIEIIKSIPFTDEIKGSEVLSGFLTKLDI